MTLIFANLTRRREMALVRLTNREKAMFLNLAFRDELRFIASVIAGGLQLPLYRGNCKTSRAGGPRSCVAACSCLPTAHLVGSRVPRDRGRAGARPSRERCRPRRGVALPRGATIGNRTRLCTKPSKPTKPPKPPKPSRPLSRRNVAEMRQK